VGDRPNPFRSWNEVEPHSFVPGVSLQAIGGDQVLLCRVSYEPGTRVSRHAHDACEQVMVILEGDATVTIEGESHRLGAGDTVVVSRGLEHEVSSEGGCIFFEALAPVPLDHVPDFARDLVLGPDGGSAHVER
jgi:quercetin dioxygenase-like cupin family protein